MKPRFCFSWFVSLLLLLGLFSIAAPQSAQAQTAPQAVGMAVGGDNLTRLLWNNPDSSVSLWRLNADATVTSYTYGPFFGWSAAGLAVGTDKTSHILWDNVGGYGMVWDVNNQGVNFNVNNEIGYGPYSGYTAAAVAVGPNNAVRVLWNNPNGSVLLWNLADASPSASYFSYGPYAGWTLPTLTVGPDSVARLLWTKPDGTAQLWKVDGGGGVDAGGTDPAPGWEALSTAVDGGGSTHLLWDHPSDNTIMLWTVSPSYSTSLLAGLTSYQTYNDPAGFRPQVLVSGPDGKLRLLWTKPDGTVQVWVISPDWSYVATTYSPYANGLRIDAGSTSAYTDSQGKNWAADYGATGGQAVPTGTAISGTSDQALYQTQRVGNSFSYSLSVPNGKYTLGLLFAETSAGVNGPGQRVFNVTANGTALLTGFDIYAAAGANTAVTKSFLVNVTTGQLNLAFTGTTGQAAVAGLSLTLPGAGAPSGDIPAPGWAEDVLPTDDASDADGDGPASAGSVNLASGVAENSPGPDLWAFNPLGPSASYARRYRSARAQQGYASPGLSAGWTDGYDLFVTPGNNAYTLTYDNGGQEQWTGTTGSLTTPPGAPYLVSVSGDTSAITMTFKDRSHYTFTQVTTAGGNYAAGTYLLTKITNLVGHAITLNRDTAANGYRLLSITNDAATPLTLLTFAYDGNGKLSTLTELTDAYSRQVTYGFTGGSLSSVSQINSPTTPLWQYGYSAVQGVSLLSSVQAPDPSHPGSMATASTAYSNIGAVAYQQDAAGRVHSYSYGGSQTTVQVANVDGSLAQSWVQKQNAGLQGKNADTGTTDAAGKSSSISYASSPCPYLPSAATNRNNQTAQVTYDTSNTYGNVLSVTSPRNVVTTYTYGNPPDFPLNQVASVMQTHLTGGTQDDSKQPVSFTYYGPTDVPTDGGPAGTINGLLHTVTSPQPDSTVANPGTPVTTTYTYDSLGNVTSTTGPNANGTMTVAYNYTTDGGFSQPEALGEPLTVTVSGPASDGTTTTTVTHYRYDSRGNRTKVMDALGNETDFAYNLADQLVSTTYPATGDSGTGQAKTTTAYQYLSGPVSSTAVYDESNTLFRQVTPTYGPEGELLSVTGSTYPVTYTYDGRGRVSSVTYYQQSLMDAHTTYYDYDAVGNLADIRYPNQSGANFDKLLYTYDADGNLIKEIDGIGLEKDYARVDPESLLTAISYVYPSGYTGTNIGTTNAVTFGYDHWGRRMGLTDSSGSKSYAYDDLDELLSQTTSFGYDATSMQHGPHNQQLTYAHNPDGSRSLRDSNTADPQVYQYDGVGRLTATYLPYAGFGSRYGYLANGWLSQQQSLYFDPNSGFGQASPYLEVDRTYNGRGFLRTLTNSLLANATVGTSASLLSSFTSMAYDPNGNRLGEISTVPPYGMAQSLSRTVQYHYDNLDELTQEASAPANGAYNTGYTYNWTYDLSGNPISSNRSVAGGFNTDNQSTSSVLYNGSTATTAFNGNGDPLSLPFFYASTSYATAFDPEDRLTGLNSQQTLLTAYDGDGLQAWNEFAPGGYGDTGGPLYSLYDGDQLVEEEDHAGEEEFFGLWGAAGLDGRYTAFAGAGGTPELVAYAAETYDPQGNAVQPVLVYPQSAQNGGNPYAVVDRSSAFDGLGHGYTLRTQSQGFLFSPVEFGGQWGYRQDFQSGLYLLTHRYYDAGAGRFITRDPIGYGGGLNLYGFAGNNPVNESDPEGYSNSLSRFLGRELSAFERAAQKAGQLAMELGEESGKATAEGYGDLTPTTPTSPILAGSPDSRAAQEENAEAARSNSRTYITYVIRNEGKVVYVGKTHGVGTPDEVLHERLRGNRHVHYFPKRGDTAQVIATQGNKDASAGAEDVYWEYYKLQGAKLRNIDPPLSMRRGQRLSNTRRKIQAYSDDLRR